MHTFIVRIALVFLVAALTACASQAPKKSVAAISPPPPMPFVASRLAVLDCKGLAPMGLQFGSLSPGHDVVRIDVPRESFDLLRDGTASGDLYRKDGFQLWVHGDTANFTRAGDAAPHACRVVPVKDAWESALRRGVSLRAFGRSPAWYLEIVPEKWILFVSDDGRRRVVVPPVAAKREGNTQFFHANAQVPAVDIVVKPAAANDVKDPKDTNCSDAAKNTPFTVSVGYEGKLFSGCGRWLRSDDPAW